MSKRRVSAVAGHTRNRGRDRRTRSAAPDLEYGVPIPQGLYEAIERERDTLGRAEALLGCLTIALEHGADVVPGPYYPDVAEMAKELVRSSINGLDCLSLQRVVLRNKVKEPPCLTLGSGSLPAHFEWVSGGAAAVAAVRPARALHRPRALHRRLYSVPASNL